MRTPDYSIASVVPAFVGVCSLVLLASNSGLAQQPRCPSTLECQKAANAAFAAEQARVGKDCLDARNQREDTACELAAAATTELNLISFYAALQGIVGSDALRGSQQAWLNYRKRQCAAIYDFFKGGTIAPSAQSRCEIELARSRMRDLEALFDVQLHH